MTPAEIKRRWYLKNKDLCRKRSYEWAKSNPDKVKKTKAGTYWRTMSPEKLLRYSARSRLRWAVRKGMVKRPSECQKCGVSCIPHGHHHKGYEWEFQFDVMWLCRSCHDREHSIGNA